MTDAAFDRGRESKLVATREALAQHLFHRARQCALSSIGLTEADTPHVNWEETDRSAWLEDADAILASGIIRDEREAKAEALDETSWLHIAETPSPAALRDMMRARAAEIRADRI